MKLYIREVSYNYLPMFRDCGRVLYVRLKDDHVSDFYDTLFPGKNVTLELGESSDDRLRALTSMKFTIVELLGERIVLKSNPPIYSNNGWGYDVSGYIEF